MNRIEDNLQIPFEHWYDAEGTRFRRWREEHPGATWDAYQRHKALAGSPSDLLPREPLSPEAARRALRADHDTGDLDARERELLDVGIAPPLTLQRIVLRFGGLLGVLSMFAAWGLSHLSMWLAVPVGLAGLVTFLVALFRPLPTAKPRR